MRTILNQLLDKKISIYSAINKIKSKPDNYITALKQLLTYSQNVYLRLFAAWALGEIKDQSSFILLHKCYKKEKEKNVRANIVWSLFRINPNMMTKKLFRDFLNDPYFTIPLVALKQMGFLKHNFKLDFKYYYVKMNNILLKAEMLRNIRFFLYETADIHVFLKKELVNSHDIFLKSELINALALINHPESLDIILQYYSKHEAEFYSSKRLASQFASSLVILCQSKGYEQLYKLYLKHDDEDIRLKIIEALVSSGGPCCANILDSLYQLEYRDYLKSYITNLSQLLIITTI